jgi:hypothetical protein
MAEFSGSGLIGLPVITADTLSRGLPTDTGNPALVDWIREAVQEGDAINHSDPSYGAIEQSMRYITGQQLDQTQLSYLPKITLNQSRKATQAHVSALTDIKPLFGWKASNDQYSFQAHLLNRRAVMWWVTTSADLVLADAIKYALAGGMGDVKCEWNPWDPFGGDNRLVACDPRDTIPVRPGNTKNVQAWQGVIFREEHTVNELRQWNPAKAHLFFASSDNVLAQVMGRFKTALARLITPVTDSLPGLEARNRASQASSGNVVLYRAYLNDRSANLSGRDVLMGPPGASWSYVVHPGEYLYPQKRLIITTDKAVVYDGPAPYWHGLFPWARLMLWSVPWQMGGIPLFNDLLPVQDAINDTMQDIRLALRQWTNRGVKYNTGAVSPATMKVFDPRKPGFRMQLNPQAGEGFALQEGAPPQTIALMLQVFQELVKQHANLSGTANLEALLQLRAQVPGADTLEAYQNALTPELRDEGRQVEAFLRPIAEMIKTNWFQFETKTRRITLLGDAGVTLEDFDWDPDTIVPALQPWTTTQDPQTGMPIVEKTPGYTPELDIDKPRNDRAKYFSRQFTFMVAPNSILAMNSQTAKMERFQLARMGYLDFWSLMETMEIPNVGTPPAIPLPPLQPVDPMAIAAEQVAAMAQGQPGPIGTKYQIDPMTGQMLEIRVPLTITERLIAQQQLGIGMSVNPAGRKASGQESPQVAEKTDESGTPRTTVTESPK